MQNIQGNAAQIITGPLSIDYGPKGTTSHFTLTCPEIGPLVQYLNFVQARGGSGTILGCDTGLDGTSAEVKSLTVSVPGLVNNLNQFIQELYFDQWELLSDHGTDSIFANPLIVDYGGQGWMTDNDKAILSYVSTNSSSIATAIAALNGEVASGTLAPPTSGGSGGNYIAPTDARSTQILVEILKGQVEYQSPNRVLRHTSYCSANALYNTNIGYEECIYTPAQLLTEVGSGWTYPLPPRLVSEISAMPFKYAAPDEAPYYRFGWLKSVSREPVLSNFIVERSTEYQLGLWSTLRYAPR